MLEYVHEKYPQLKTTIDISNWGKKLHNEKDYYMKKRNPDLKLTKEELQEKIQDIFRTCESSKQFYAVLEFDGFKTYTYKESIQGIYFGEEEKKMRFSRLGIDKEQIAELDKQYERLQELEKLNTPAKTITLDHYRYDMNDISGNPTGINPDQDIENNENEQDLENEFAQIMRYPIQEENKEIEYELNELEKETENDFNSKETENVTDLDSDNDIDSDPEPDDDQSENDIDDLENDTQNDLDTDNDMDMDSEP